MKTYEETSELDNLKNIYQTNLNRNAIMNDKFKTQNKNISEKF